MAGITNFLGDLAGYYRDIKVAEASPNGVASTNARPESIPDQSSVGAIPPTGPGANQPASNPSNMSVFGVQMNRGLVYGTAAVLGTLALIKVIK